MPTRRSINAICTAVTTVGMLAAALAMAPNASSAADVNGSTSVGQPASAASLPVILLTGFEPFGPERPANPSWEGIKALDGQQWRGHRLVCRQMRVIWGEPLRQLPKWIDQLNPVAIFAFGQGGDYALETVARNQRAVLPDNAGRLPPEPQIVAGGPDERQTSLDVDGLIQELGDAGYRVRASRNAGAYLCEETLYTLEHLKAAGEAPGVVAFCHVPPLGAKKENGEKVTASDVEEFVQGFLDAWMKSRAPASVSPASAPTLQQAASPKVGSANVKEQEQAVRQLIDRYFRSWSAQDLVRYGRCFAPQAVVQLVDASGGLTTMPLGPFLRSQQEAHRRATAPMIETPESVDVRFDAHLAHALVYWKLVEGERLEYGYDHFTLVRQEGQWRIAHLIFYSAKEKSTDGGNQTGGQNSTRTE